STSRGRSLRWPRPWPRLSTARRTRSPLISSRRSRRSAAAGWSSKWRPDGVTVADVLRALTALGLPGCECPMPAEPLDDGQWVELRAAVNRERMWGLLGWAVANGQLPATPAQAAEAERSHRRAMEDVLELEALAITTADLLASVGIGCRALKGLAVAHLDEPDPSLRCFN